MSEVISYEPTAVTVMPVMDIQQAISRRNQMVNFVRSIMVEDIDYGTVPGTDKPTLYKPGAEKLTTFFGLSPRFEIVKAIEQWGEDGDEPFFYYWYKCKLYRGSYLIGEGEGSCNSHEGKYRWRWVGEEDLPPGVDVSAFKKREGSVAEFKFAVDKAETTGKYGKPPAYWEQFNEAIQQGKAREVQRTTAKGGIYPAWEIDATMYRVPNEDIASLVNTVLKMAQKRALIAATLVAVNASEFFTQDLEDLDIDIPAAVTTAPSTEVDPKRPAPKPKNEAKRAKATGATNGKNGNDNGRSWPSDTIQAVVPKYADNPAHAVQMLNLSEKLTPRDAPDIVIQWCEFYRGARAAGDEPEAAATYADGKLELPEAEPA